MQRNQLQELHYITSMPNVPSICQLGILCHTAAAKVKHESVAMQVIQDKRATVKVPPGIPLHDFANLYICARNPMLYKRLNKHKSICILRVSTDALDISGAVVTTGNASSDYVRFAAAPNGLSHVDRDLVFAQSWNDSDYFEKCRKKVAKCAELLVPDCVMPDYLIGAYVSCEEALSTFKALSTGLEVEINRDLFFYVS